MISFDEAYECVMSSVRLLAAERVGLHDAWNRILAEDVRADRDLPPFPKSAMDGFACRREDLQNDLVVVETIQAGSMPRITLGKNECAKIMTGARLPEGADCVIEVELTAQVAENAIRFTGAKAPNNICFQGEDIRQGELVIAKGTRLGPPGIAMLATMGCTQPLVACRPRVGIIATGTELVEPWVEPSESQIRNSNSCQLWAHVLSMAAVPSYYGIAQDTEAAIEAAINTARANSDVLLLSGGVSVGEFDLVPGILSKIGAKTLFDKIAVKPGKPTLFGLLDHTYFFGLPGNPVSVFVLFELLVKPFLYGLMGRRFSPETVTAPLETTVLRKHYDREMWLPVSFTVRGGVATVEYHGSAHIHAFCFADGLIRVPAGTREIPEGAPVHVRRIQA
jgi:molybdopterin molybdotransferase